MELVTEERADGVTWVTLDGRLDIAGSSLIDLRFNTIAGARRAIVVDLSRVTFLASMGMRLLLTGAKAVTSKGGRMVLHAPEPNVEKALTTAGIDSVIPIHHDAASALAATRTVTHG